jgi:hypothetical protein
MTKRLWTRFSSQPHAIISALRKLRADKFEDAQGESWNTYAYETIDEVLDLITPLLEPGGEWVRKDEICFTCGTTRLEDCEGHGA